MNVTRDQGKILSDLFRFLNLHDAKNDLDQA